MSELKVYLGQTRSQEWISKLESFGFGEMTVRGELPNRRHPWAFDNGAFRDWTAGKPFDVKRYESDLDYLHLHSKTNPDFIMAPDIVAGGLQSLDLFLEWAPRLKRFAPVCLCVQDGMGFSDVEPVLGDFGGIFVGGSLPWKIRTAENWVNLAHEHGKKLHIGRVGTENRVRWARRIGADSIDSCLPLWAEANFRRFLRGFRDRPERDFFTEAMPMSRPARSSGAKEAA